jgi:hypothetical protein
VIHVLHPVLQTHQLGVIGMALVRDSLKDSGEESVSGACRRPSWMVSRKDFNIWFPSTRRERSKEAQMDQLTWQLQPTGGEGMRAYNHQFINSKLHMAN